MAALSLEGAIRTCKVDTAYANKMQSDRFLNPANMVCPIWNGLDTSGRPVCADSFITKTAGCNNPLDRIQVENDVSRPQYTEYVTLDAGGIKGNIYGSGNVHKMTGQFGLTTQFSEINPRCRTQGRSTEPSKTPTVAPPVNSGRM